MFKTDLGAPVQAPALDDADDFDPEACPGCGCVPGEGITDDCEHPDGCGKDNDHGDEREASHQDLA